MKYAFDSWLETIVSAENAASNSDRRLYFALRKLYNNPLQAKIKVLDDNYSELTIGAHLPNREYYCMMLCAWPDQSVENRYKFIVRNQSVCLIKEILNNLAIEIKGE